MFNIILFDDNTEQFNEIVIELQKDNYKIDLVNVLEQFTTGTEPDFQFESFRGYCDEKIFNRTIDVIGCDMNLGFAQETAFIEILTHIRKSNKSCKLFLYSGSINKIVEAINEKGSNPQKEKPMRDLFKIQVEDIVSRDKVIEKIKEITASPSVLNILENKINEIHNGLFLCCFDEFKGLTKSDITRNIREYNEIGVRFITEFINYAVSGFINQ